MTVIHEKAPIATLEGAQQVALDQAASLAEQATRIQELIRERDTALYKQDEAFALAAEYARRGGLEITHAEIAQQLAHEQRLLTSLDRRNHILEGFHFSVWQQYVLFLQPRRGRGMTAEELREFADAIAKLLDWCGKDKPGPREKAGQTELFAISASTTGGTG